MDPRARSGGALICPEPGCDYVRTYSAGTYKTAMAEYRQHRIEDLAELTERTW